jgi:Fe-S oxidoreductase
MMGFFDKMLGGNILFYPGCMEKFVLKKNQEDYEKILRKCGIDFIKLKDLEQCCGSPVLNAGYEMDFETIVKKNYKIFKEHGIKKIITPCPACFKTFKLEYPKYLNNFDIEVEHISQTVWSAIKNGKLKMKKVSKPVKVTYHDPCHLGRYCGVYDEPREIIKSLGYELVEMKFNKEMAWCCGGGGGLKSNYPELADEITKMRLKQAKDVKAYMIVTSCPMCFSCFEQVSKGKIRVVELSTFLIDNII